MLKIGAFAWLSRVSVETLRHYDRIGLLRPCQQDPFTGYRYYTLEQLPVLNRILALKGLGLPLAEIQRLIEGDLSPQEARRILIEKRDELVAQAEEIRQRLQRVEDWIRQVDLEGQMPEHQVLIKRVPAQWIASTRATLVSFDQEVLGPMLTGMFEEVGEFVYARGAQPAGPGAAIWHEPEGNSANPDIETALPLAKPIEANGKMKVYQSEEMDVAYVVVHGSFAGLGPARNTVVTWLEKNGYEITGPSREVYLYFDPDRENNQDSPHHVTEVQVPVRKK
jgi:DNA-binding transcriptional MerR regulator